jgi:hypothetical protein
VENKKVQGKGFEHQFTGKKHKLSPKTNNSVIILSELEIVP